LESRYLHLSILRFLCMAEQSSLFFHPQLVSYSLSTSFLRLVLPKLKAVHTPERIPSSALLFSLSLYLGSTRRRRTWRGSNLPVVGGKKSDDCSAMHKNRSIERWRNLDSTPIHPTTCGVGLMNVLKARRCCAFVVIE